MGLDIVQSVPICLGLASAGGAIEVLATAVLAYQDAKERKEGVPWSPVAKYGNLGLHLMLQITSSIIGNLFAPWFGPVSLVGPVFLSAQLLANMIVFGTFLGLENFTKDMRVGTYIVVIAVVLLPIVGPTAQDDQNAMELLKAWYALAWSVIQVVLMVISFVVMLVWDVSTFRNERQKISILLVARATAFTVNLTVSKVMIMQIDSIWFLLTLIVLKILSGGVTTYALVIQSTAVPQAKFVPLNASALILVNALTGMIVWEDWRVMGNWIGYISVFVQLVLGNYLLLGDDVEMLSPENPKYGRAKSIFMAKEGIAYRHSLFTINESVLQEVKDSLRSETENGDDARQYLELDEPPPATATNGHRRQQRRTSTAQEAWSSVFGLDRPGGGTRRRRTIFVMDRDSSDYGTTEYGTGELDRFT